MVNRGAYDAAVATGLSPGDWFREAHRELWRAMRALRERGVVLDLLTVRDQLAEVGRLDSVGGPAYVARLTDGLPTSANVAHYAQIVIRDAARRRLGEAAVRGAPVATLEAEIARLREADAAPNEDDSPFVDVLADTSKLVPDEGLPGLAWPNRLAIVAGEPKAGKSTLLAQAIAAAVMGERFLDREPKVAGQIAIVTEEPMGMVGARLRKHGMTNESRVFAASPAAGGRLLPALRKLDADLIVIDTFTALAVAWGAETLNDAAGMRRVMDSLRSLTVGGAAVLVVHHVRKADGVLADSRDIGAAADMLVTFEAIDSAGERVRRGDSDRRRLSYVGRWPVDTVTLDFDRTKTEYYDADRWRKGVA